MASSSRKESRDGRNMDNQVNSFLSEIKKVEKRDAVLTKEQQIERLTKPGSKYGNLNPFAVLMVGYDADIDTARKQFRKLSILTHPDKNPDDKEKSQRAFDAVKAAWETLSDSDKRETCNNVVENAQKTLDMEIADKRKDMRSKHKTVIIAEDDPSVYKQELHKKCVKLFADLERLKHEIADRESEMRRRVADAEAQEQVDDKRKKEFAKNFEATRQKRTDSWNSFQKGGSSSSSAAPVASAAKVSSGKKKKVKGFFKPPKHKIEKR